MNGHEKNGPFFPWPFPSSPGVKLPPAGRGLPPHSLHRGAHRDALRGALRRGAAEAGHGMGALRSNGEDVEVQTETIY